MTERVRRKAFASLLRQEIAYFDRPENNTGAISTRLSSDALAVQEMSGARLGMICETFAMLVCALVLGLLFSWQLTLIESVVVLIMFTITLLGIGIHKRVRHATGVSLERAHSVRTNQMITFERDSKRNNCS